MCFSLVSIEHLLIWVVIVLAIFAVIRVLLGLVSPPPEFQGAYNAAIQIARIILWDRQQHNDDQ
jgi:hypothetical protein